MTTLITEALSVARGDRIVLTGLSLRFGAGEVLHLLGENGAGKTSLLEVLSGLRLPHGGKIQGQPEVDALHWLGHRNGLHPALSGLENLAYWTRLQNESRADIEAALKRVGLWSLRHRPCGRLSTGQKRRVALARLLAVKRPWWFLDEPLAGLDISGTELVADMLDEHATQGGIAVVSSHQPFPRPITGLISVVLA